MRWFAPSRQQLSTHSCRCSLFCAADRACVASDGQSALVSVDRVILRWRAMTCVGIVTFAFGVSCVVLEIVGPKPSAFFADAVMGGLGAFFVVFGLRGADEAGAHFYRGHRLQLGENASRSLAGDRHHHSRSATGDSGSASRRWRRRGRESGTVNCKHRDRPRQAICTIRSGYRRGPTPGASVAPNCRSVPLVSSVNWSPRAWGLHSRSRERHRSDRCGSLRLAPFVVDRRRGGRESPRR